MTPQELVGKSYTFDDGNKIEVIQCKVAEPDQGGHLITYLTTVGPGIPRKLVMGGPEFINTFGHLFKE